MKASLQGPALTQRARWVRRRLTARRSVNATTVATGAAVVSLPHPLLGVDVQRPMSQV